VSEFALYANLMKLGIGIDACLKEKVYPPALILLYSAIDVAGWLATSKEFASRTSFISWVNTFLLPAKALECSAVDLYAARCGMLHSLTPYAEPRKGERPRLICYAFGTGRVEDVREAIDCIRGSERYVAAHFDDLYEAWRLGIGRFVEELDEDPERKSRAYAKAKKFFATMSPEVLDQALVQMRSGLFATFPRKKT